MNVYFSSKDEHFFEWLNGIKILWKNLESRFFSGYTREYFVVWYSWAGISMIRKCILRLINKHRTLYLSLMYNLTFHDEPYLRRFKCYNLRLCPGLQHYAIRSIYVYINLAVCLIFVYQVTHFCGIYNQGPVMKKLKKCKRVGTEKK